MKGFCRKCAGDFDGLGVAFRGDSHAFGRTDDHSLSGTFHVLAVYALAVEIGGVVVVGEGGIIVFSAYDGTIVTVCGGDRIAGVEAALYGCVIITTL